MSNTLFVIERDLIQLNSAIESENEFAGDDESLALLKQQLVIKKEELATKASGYVHIIAKLAAQEAMADIQIAKAKKFKEIKEKARLQWEGALLQALLLFGDEDKSGVKHIEAGIDRLSTRKSSTVKILDEEAVTDDCKTYDVTFKGITPEIKKFLSNRIHDLPDGIGKKALIAAFSVDINLKKLLIKAKIKSDPLIEWAELEENQKLVIK